MSWIKETHIRNIQFALNSRNVRWFCTILLLIISFLIWYKEWPIGFALTGLTIYLGFGLIFTVVIFPFLYVWMWITSILGEIISTIFLGAIYFVVFSPISLFVRKKYKSGWVKKEDFSASDKQY